MSSLTDILLNIPGPGGTLPIIEPPPPEATEPPTTRATGPSSQIDPTLPVYGNPTTQSVRQNFATAQVEITGLMQATVGAPFLALAGGKMGGPMYLYNDPTDVMMPVTLGYFQTHGGGGPGAGGIPEAPSDGAFYLRSQGAWVPGVALSGGTTCQMTGELWLAGNPTDPLGAVPKQYADAIATTANGAVQRGGDIMTGLLTLSGDPTAPLGAVTKQYTDAGLALKANAANPTFTGIVTVATAGRVIVQGPTNPSLTLYNTTSGQPCFGIYNSGGYLGFGLAVPTTGNPSGTPYAAMDQNGNFGFTGRVNVTSGRLISSSSTTTPSITLNDGGTYIYGLWSNSTNNLLALGICDASGAPQTPLWTIDNGGNLISNGAFSSTAGILILGNYALFAGSPTQSGFLHITANPNGNINSIGVWCNSFSITGGGSLAVDTNISAGGSIASSHDINASGNVYCINTVASGGVEIAGNWITGNGGWVYMPYLQVGTTIQSNGNITAATSINAATTNAAYNGSTFMSQYGIVYGSLGYQNQIGFNIPAGGLAYMVDGTNMGWVVPPSDESIKTNIAEPDLDALDVLGKIELKQFDMPSYVPDETEHYGVGFILQQVREVIPEAANAGTLNLSPLVAYNTRAIQQLAERVAALEGTRK